jgi:hypothetical protein
LGDPVRFIKTFQHGMFISFFSAIVWHGSQTKRTKNSYMGLPRFLSCPRKSLVSDFGMKTLCFSQLCFHMKESLPASQHFCGTLFHCSFGPPKEPKARAAEYLLPTCCLKPKIPHPPIGEGILNGFFTVWVPNKSSESTSSAHQAQLWLMVTCFSGGLFGYGSH